MSPSSSLREQRRVMVNLRESGSWRRVLLFRSQPSAHRPSRFLSPAELQQQSAFFFGKASSSHKPETNLHIQDHTQGFHTENTAKCVKQRHLAGPLCPPHVDDTFQTGRWPSADSVPSLPSHSRMWKVVFWSLCIYLFICMRVIRITQKVLNRIAW